MTLVDDQNGEWLLLYQHISPMKAQLCFFPLFRHVHLYPATISGVGLSDHESEARQPVDKLDRRMMANEQALRNLGDAKPIRFGSAFDREVSLMLRREARPTRRILAKS